MVISCWPPPTSNHQPVSVRLRVSLSQLEPVTRSSTFSPVTICNLNKQCEISSVCPLDRHYSDVTRFSGRCSWVEVAPDDEWNFDWFCGRLECAERSMLTWKEVTNLSIENICHSSCYICSLNSAHCFSNENSLFKAKSFNIWSVFLILCAPLSTFWLHLSFCTQLQTSIFVSVLESDCPEVLEDPTSAWFSNVLRLWWWV